MRLFDSSSCFTLVWLSIVCFGSSPFPLTSSLFEPSKSLRFLFDVVLSELSFYEFYFILFTEVCFITKFFFSFLLLLSSSVDTLSESSFEFYFFLSSFYFFSSFYSFFSLFNNPYSLSNNPSCFFSAILCLSASLSNFFYLFSNLAILSSIFAFFALIFSI